MCQSITFDLNEKMDESNSVMNYTVKIKLYRVVFSSGEVQLIYFSVWSND